MKPIRAATVQFEHAPGDKDANLRSIRQFVERAAQRGAQITAFPECCLTGYWHLRHLTREQMLALAELVPDGGLCAALRKLSKESGVTIGAGLIERTSQGQLFNAYFVAMPNGDWRCHRKLHAFVNPHLSNGFEYTIFDDPHGCRVGVLTCYDNNIIENVRITALQGAEILLAPHQTGGCRLKDPHSMGGIDPQLWRDRRNNPEAIRAELVGPKGRGWLMRWLPSRAHDNGLFIVFSNGIGIDDDEVRTGNAMVLDPYGRILAESNELDEDCVVADLDPSLLETCTGRRWIRSRRPDLYGPLTVPTGSEVETRVLRMGK